MSCTYVPISCFDFLTLYISCSSKRPTLVVCLNMYILLFTFATVRHGSREKEWAHQHAEGTEHFEVFPAVAQISIENEQRIISENQYIISSNMDVDSCNMST